MGGDVVVAGGDVVGDFRDGIGAEDLGSAAHHPLERAAELLVVHRVLLSDLVVRRGDAAGGRPRGDSLLPRGWLGALRAGLRDGVADVRGARRGAVDEELSEEIVELGPILGAAEDDRGGDVRSGRRERVGVREVARGGENVEGEEDAARVDLLARVELASQRRERQARPEPGGEPAGLRQQGQDRVERVLVVREVEHVLGDPELRGLERRRHRDREVETRGEARRNARETHEARARGGKLCEEGWKKETLLLELGPPPAGRRSL
jgi:hypothetical protein